MIDSIMSHSALRKDDSGFISKEMLDEACQLLMLHWQELKSSGLDLQLRGNVSLAD